MTATIARDSRSTKTTIIDCDVHNALTGDDALEPYLSERWRAYHRSFSRRIHSGADYSRTYPNAARVDAWPPSGMPPGSELEFLREQLFEPWPIEYGILNALTGAPDQLNAEYADALCSAVNDWQVVTWLDPEPRLRASIVVPYEDGELATAEIERCADDDRFVQVGMIVRTQEPLGRRKYWPMFAAAEAAGLPIGVHFGGAGGGPTTGVGFPSFYIEEHAGMSTAFQDQLTSLVFAGVFERFPRLKLVVIEAGFAWLLPLMWRLDRSWKLLKSEVPHVERLPSETIREHVWITTQPMEEPSSDADLVELLDRLEMDDKIMFATDYPHWDFDAPDRALPTRIGVERRRKIMAENARALYGLPRADEG
jgi:predicted TIM-barrel fold metal-dependent hydrolase